MYNRKEIFNSLYQEYWDGIYRLALGYVNDSGWAKDIAQETFISVWDNLPGFRNEASYKTWLYRIASNICLRQLKRSTKVKYDTLIVQQKEAEAEESYHETDTTKLYRAISELSEMNRIIISLTLEGIDQKEIANITGLNHSNVRIRIYRIKEELYQMLK